MPAFDLPLDELRTYPGRNPRPADLDAYWDAALAELAAVDPQHELVPVDHPSPGIECFDARFTGVGGARLYAKHLRPRDPALRTGQAVAVFHGYSAASPDWFELIPFAAQGFSVLALDCRGQGGRSPDPGVVPGTTFLGHIVRGLEGAPEDLLFRRIYLDTVQTVRVLQRLDGVDPARVGATGASQGGGLTLACAALEPSVRAAASVYPFLCDFQRVWELDLAEDAYGELRQHLRRFDPTHERFDGMFERLGYIDVAHLAPRIRADVLMLTGLMDRICPPSTQFAAYNRITSSKEMVIYPDFEHEDLPGGLDRVLAFLADRL